MIEYDQKDMDRFRSKIFEVTEGEHKGCYETICCKNKDGYSSIGIKGKNVYAHRLIYQIHHPDEDIDNKLICHRCDNPACVNIAHLFSGTRQDNMTDMVNKDRQVKGSDVVISKLIEEDIIEMINLTLSGHFTSCVEISKHYDVHVLCIHDIIKQKTWKHITKDFDMVKVKSLLRNDQRGSNHPYSAFDDDQVREIRARLKNGETKTSLSKFYHVSFANINNIAIGKSYQNVV